MGTMPESRPKRFRRFVLAGALAAIHTALFIFVAIAVSLSPDPETGMAYFLFWSLDYPLSRLYEHLPRFPSPFVMMPVLGGLLWFCYGFILQSLFSIRRIADLPRLGIGVVFLVLLCLLPEFSLRSMPGWEEHWRRG